MVEPSGRAVEGRGEIVDTLEEIVQRFRRGGKGPGDNRGRHVRRVTERVRRPAYDASRRRLGLPSRRADTAESAPMKKEKQRKSARSNDEGAYICSACGEEIVIPVDRSAGSEQEYVEDCPVCCRPNRLRVEFFDDPESVRVSAEPE
jgi:hypothetical protein